MGSSRSTYARRVAAGECKYKRSLACTKIPAEGRTSCPTCTAIDNGRRRKHDRKSLRIGWESTAVTAHDGPLLPRAARVRKQQHQLLMQKVAARYDEGLRVSIPGIRTDGMVRDGDGLLLIEGKPRASTKNDIDAIDKGLGQLHRYRWLVEESGWVVNQMIVASEHKLTDAGRRFLATTPLKYMEV